MMKLELKVPDAPWALRRDSTCRMRSVRELQKTAYLDPEEWAALKKKSYEEARPVSARAYLVSSSVKSGISSGSKPILISRSVLRSASRERMKSEGSSAFPDSPAGRGTRPVAK